MKLTESQIHEAAKIMADRHYGGFASALACAYFMADSSNKARILEAFGDLFERVYVNAQSTNQA